MAVPVMGRLLALLIAVVGGALGAWLGTTLAGGMLFGVLWLYVLGDDPWPQWVMPLGFNLLLLFGLGLWLFLALRIWRMLRAGAR